MRREVATGVALACALALGLWNRTGHREPHVSAVGRRSTASPTLTARDDRVGDHHTHNPVRPHRYGRRLAVGAGRGCGLRDHPLHRRHPWRLQRERQRHGHYRSRQPRARCPRAQLPGRHHGRRRLHRLQQLRLDRASERRVERSTRTWRPASVTANGWVVGDPIQAGEQIGLEADIGRAGGPHLHFEVGRPYDREPTTRRRSASSAGSCSAARWHATSAINLVPRVCDIRGQPLRGRRGLHRQSVHAPAADRRRWRAIRRRRGIDRACSTAPEAATLRTIR